MSHMSHIFRRCRGERKDAAMQGRKEELKRISSCRLRVEFDVQFLKTCQSKAQIFPQARLNDRQRSRNDLT